MAEQEPGKLDRAENAREAETHRLQVLVGELVAANQELRFKVSALERQLERARLSLAQTATWAGNLFP